jgi:hypothetical protein
MGVHKDKEIGIREIRHWIDNAFDCIPMQWDAFYLNKNRKWVTKETLTETITSQ